MDYAKVELETLAAMIERLRAELRADEHVNKAFGQFNKAAYNLVKMASFGSIYGASPSAVHRAITTSRSPLIKSEMSGDVRTAINALRGRELLNPGDKGHKRLNGKKRNRPIRVLDHSAGWRDTGARSRYTIVRWSGPTPPEWTRVGWSVIETTYASKPDALRAIEAFESVLEVLES